ncbi:MAG: transketolase family protein [Desulfovibrionaceae bacterium]
MKQTSSAVTLSTMDMRDAFITRLDAKARQDRDIVFLCNDYGAPSLDRFRTDMPDQFFNMAISEQNMISVAAGMAMQGKKVFVYSIASFLTLRCLEQVKIDICCMNLPVTLVGVGTSYAYSADGPTHHATEDMAVMRCLANMAVYSPPDSSAAGMLVEVALRQDGPKYFRFDKGKYPVVYEDALPDCGFSVLRQGDGPCLVATGTMTSRAVEVADALAGQGVACTVVDLVRVKPLDAGLADVLAAHRHVVTIEEHALTGGIGSAVAELVVDNGLDCRLKRAAIAENKLYAYGMRNRMHEERGLSTARLVETITAWTA